MQRSTLEDVNSGKGKLGKISLTTKGMWKRKWRKVGIAKTNDSMNSTQSSLANQRWTFRKPWWWFVYNYANTSKASWREVFPLRWKVTPYFSTVNFIIRPLYPKGLFTQILPVQWIIQVLQFSFYSPKSSLWDDSDTY